MKRSILLYLVGLLIGFQLYSQKDLPVFAQYGECFLNAGKCDEVIIEEDIAYVGSHAGLLILDISDPGNPEFESCFYTDKFVYNLFVTDTLAFVVSAGLWDPIVSIINISNLNNPILINSFETAGFENKTIFVKDDFLFLGLGYSGLYIYDISDLTNPICIYQSFDIKPIDLVVRDNYVYMVANQDYFGILDISTINEPELLCWIGDYSTTRYAIDLQGDYAYIGGTTFDIFDISNPSNPDQLCEIKIDEYSLNDLFVNGNFCYSLSGDSLYVVNIEDPNIPEIIFYYPYEGSFLGFEDNTLLVTKDYVSETPVGIGFFEIDELQQINFNSEFITDEAKEVYVNGNYAYVANGYNGLKIINIAVPSNPIPVSNCLKEYYVYEAIIENDLAYVRINDGLKIVDVNDPELPYIIGGYDLFPGIPISEYALEKYSDYIYLGGYLSNVYIINVSDPFNPYYAGLLDVYDWSPDMEVYNDHLYVAGYWGGFQIFDLLDPVNPQMTGYYPLDLALKIAVGENMAFIGAGSIANFDLSDITNPVCVGGYNLGGGTDMQCTGNYLLAGKRGYQEINSGIHVIDVSDLSNPVLKQEILNVSPNGLYYDNGKIYVVEDYRFKIFGDTLTVSVDENYVYKNELELSCFPNPAIDKTTIQFQLSNTSYTKLSIYNGRGELISNPIQGNLTKGLQSINWDCRNYSGYKVASGIYIISLLINNYHISKKIIVTGH
ncbi:MAG: T9SS type A sorting domain-containing protein [Bacteroidales bacterium]|nr:T9SS type A sorting domain-containing protein [Bacteroidales bacterium]